MTKKKMAMLVVQARRASRCGPDENDPEVSMTAQKPMKELEVLFLWAQQDMSAMRWNTLTAEMR